MAGKQIDRSIVTGVILGHLCHFCDLAFCNCCLHQSFIKERIMGMAQKLF